MIKKIKAFWNWKTRQFAAPSPFFVKQACLRRNGIKSALWVETGTYLGETAKFLSRFGMKIYTIEPSDTFYQKAKYKLMNIGNVHVIHGSSEDVFPTLIPTLRGNVNFWLDGHYSGGKTFKGDKNSPIAFELATISKNLNLLKNVCIMIDDIRCFSDDENNDGSYPPLDELVIWSKDHGFSWHIEHDIFVAKNFVS